MDHHPFSRLQPELILDAVENLGFTTNGRILALNSYENRVYQIGVDDFGGTPVVVKFYRPQRWTDAAILEEHHYTRTLADHEIPVAAPLAPRGNQTLYEYDGFRYAVYLSRGGRWPPWTDRNTCAGSAGSLDASMRSVPRSGFSTGRR